MQYVHSLCVISGPPQAAHADREHFCGSSQGFAGSGWRHQCHDGSKIPWGRQEWDQEEIDDFTKKFWPADLFFDESRKIFTSLTDGQETKLSLLQLANPFSAAWKAARKAKQTVTDSNFKAHPFPVHSNWSRSSLVS